MKKVLFVVNPNAGKRKARRYLADILEIFSQAQYTVITHITTGRGNAAQIVESMAQSVDLVVCCGGDGTFNEAVNGLMRCGAPTPIGYIPAGSTNDFAASLRLSTDPVEAARDIVSGETFHYDIGQFDDRYFTYIASFGAFTRASYATSQSVKNVLGHAAYVLEGIKDISQIRPIHIKMELDEEIIEDDFIFGSISNSTSVAGILTLDPQRVDMSDGVFEILLVRAPQKMGELTACIQALQTRRYDCQMITFRNSAHIRVFSDDPLVWTLDGERADAQPVVEIENHHLAIGLIRKGKT